MFMSLKLQQDDFYNCIKTSKGGWDVRNENKFRNGSRMHKEEKRIKKKTKLL